MYKMLIHFKMSYDYSHNRCYKKTFTIINHKVSIRLWKNTSKCKNINEQTQLNIQYQPINVKKYLMLAETDILIIVHLTVHILMVTDMLIWLSI